MRRIEEGLAAILVEIEDRLTFYNLNISKRSFKPAIFRFSTVCLALFLIITMSPLITPNYTNSFLRIIYGQGSGNETAPPEIFVPAGDTIPPDIIVPDDITEEVTTGPSGTPVEYAVTAEDNVDGTAILEQDGFIVRQDDVGGSITISCSPPSGFEFPIDNTAVECTATDASGNEGEGFFTITVQEAVVGPQPTIDPLTVGIISNGTEGVAPATFELQAIITGGTGPYTYLWDFGDGSEETEEQTVVHTFEEAGTYNVLLTAIDNSNQNASDSLEINVGAAPPPPPSVEIMPSSIVGFAPATFDFEANVIGGTEPFTHSWNFVGDETEDSNESTVSHTFEGVGIYDVALTITDSNVLTASDEIAIIVVPSIVWVILVVVLAPIVIGCIVLAKYKMNQRRRGPRMDIPTSSIVEITAKGGIDQ